MNELKINEFIIAYTKGIDLINCVKNSIDNDFVKPEDYDDYGCNIEFITKEKSNVKDENSLKEWNIYHHNSFCVPQIGPDSPTGFSFPPPFNFIDEESIIINSNTENNAEVEVGTNNGNYIFNLISSDKNEYGIIIKSIFMDLPWGAGRVGIVE